MPWLADDFEVAFAAVRKTGFAFALSRLCNEYDAQDALQEAAMGWWRYGTTGDPVQDRKIFFGILGNKVVDCARRRGQGREGVREGEEDGPTGVFEEMAEKDAGPALGLEQREQREWLEKHLMRLPERERRVIELTFFQEQSDRQIGEALGVPERRVRVLRFRALQVLRRRLK